MSTPEIADRDRGREVEMDQRNDFNNVQREKSFENKKNFEKQIILHSAVDKSSKSNLGVDARLREKYGSARIQQEKHEPDYNEFSTWFHNSFEDNLAVITNYSIGSANQYLEKLGTHKKEPNTTVDFPVFVTAANSGFFGVTQALLKSIHEIIMPKYKALKIMYYDFDLLDADVKKWKQCRCEVRKFPFEEFPSHVGQLKTYAWKPIIMMGVYFAYGIHGICTQANASLQFLNEDWRKSPSKCLKMFLDKNGRKKKIDD